MTKAYIFLVSTLIVVLVLFVAFYHDQIAAKWDELTGEPTTVYEDDDEQTAQEVFDAWDKALGELASSSSKGK